MFWHELRNLLLSDKLLGRIDDRYSHASMSRLRRLPIHLAGEAADRHIMAFARTHLLTAYDASYLALAIRENCPMLSLDRRLNEAAVAEGVARFA